MPEWHRQEGWSLTIMSLVVSTITLPLRPVPKGGSGGSEEPSRAATRSAQPNEIFFFSSCVLFVSGPCCNHSVFTARMHNIAGFGSIFPKFSGGACPRTPLEELALRQAHFGRPENKQNPPIWTLAYGRASCFFRACLNKIVSSWAWPSQKARQESENSSYHFHRLL